MFENKGESTSPPDRGRTLSPASTGETPLNQPFTLTRAYTDTQSFAIANTLLESCNQSNPAPREVEKWL